MSANLTDIKRTPDSSPGALFLYDFLKRFFVFALGDMLIKALVNVFEIGYKALVKTGAFFCYVSFGKTVIGPVSLEIIIIVDQPAV